MAKSDIEVEREVWNKIVDERDERIERCVDALRAVVDHGPPLNMWADQDAAARVREALATETR